jgi:hypothetical protein
MIHILDSSLVPSTAQIIQIPGTGSSTPPAQVTGLLPQEVLSLIYHGLRTQAQTM